jgi:hypothetical protein
MARSHEVKYRAYLPTILRRPHPKVSPPVAKSAGEDMTWLRLNVLMTLRAVERVAVAVSMFPLLPRATRMVSGLDFEIKMALVGWVPVLLIPEMMTLPAPMVPAAAS